MALSEAERVQVRLYCGWSARFFQFDSELEQAMNALDSKPDTEALIQSLLVECARIDAAIISSAENHFKALEVDSIKLNPMELERWRSRGRQFSGRILQTLGVEAGPNDPWSGSMPKQRHSRWGYTGGGYQMQG